MTNPTRRLIIKIIDRSASMRECADGRSGPSRADVANDGIQAFLASQADNPLHTQVSLYEFDDLYGTVVEFAELSNPLLTGYKIEPRGNTALLGATGFTIDKVGGQLAALPEADRPREVTVVIVTDGKENWSYTNEWSRIYTLDRVRSMVERQQQQYDWHFVYLGATLDAFDQGTSMGVPAASVARYATRNTGAAYASAGQSLNTATASAGPPVFTDVMLAEMVDGEED